MKSRTVNTTPNPADRDAEEQLLQHISALHARLSVSVEKLIAPLRDQIIAYKEVVAPLSQDLKKNLAVSWPLLEELQKQDNAFQTAIQGLQQKIDQVDQSTVGLVEATSAGAAFQNEQAERTESILSILGPISEQMMASQSGLSAVSDALQAAGAAIEQSQSESLDRLGGQLDAARDMILELRNLVEVGESAREAETGDLKLKLDTILQEVANLVGSQSAEDIAADRLEHVIEGQGQIAIELREINQKQGSIGNEFQSLAADIQVGISSLSQALAAFSEASTADRDQSLGAVRAELESGISVISQSIAALEAAHKSVTTEDLEALKFEVQSGVSTIYASVADVQAKLNENASDDLQAARNALDVSLSGLQDLMTGGFDSANAHLASLATQVGELQSRDDSAQADEIRAQVSKLDWSLQSVGQNIAALGNKLASIQEDVSNPPMARRTLKAIEDVDHQVGQIARALRTGTSLPVSSNPEESGSAVQIESMLSEVRDLLIDIGSQISDALRYYFQEVNRVILESSSIERRPGESGSPDPASRFAGLEAAALQAMTWLRKAGGAAPASLAGYDETQFETQLKNLDPVTFEKWKPVFDAGAIAYQESPNENCATWTSDVARGFRDYLALFAEGPMLDIGCGPVGRPVYLQGYDPSQIKGIEPLPVTGAADFDVIRGVAEFLPWPDRSFATVICATALDHVMDLERSLAEMHRVLREDGKLVLWYANMPGMPDYAATPSADRAAVDAYHLFHIDDAWLQPLLARWFEIVDLRQYPAGGGMSDVFAVYRPRKSVRDAVLPVDAVTRKGKPGRRKAARAKAGKTVSGKAKKPVAQTAKAAPANPAGPRRGSRRKPSGTVAKS